MRFGNNATKFKTRLCASRLSHSLYLSVCCFGGILLRKKRWTCGQKSNKSPYHPPFISSLGVLRRAHPRRLWSPNHPDLLATSDSKAPISTTMSFPIAYTLIHFADFWVAGLVFPRSCFNLFSRTSMIFRLSSGNLMIGPQLPRQEKAKNVRPASGCRITVVSLSTFKTISVPY